MVIVTGAFVAQHAQEQIGGEGTLLIEKAGLPRAQIGADGNTEVLALVVVIESDLEEPEIEGGQQQRRAVASVPALAKPRQLSAFTAGANDTADQHAPRL